MPKRPAGVAQLRQLVRDQVENTSIRAVAEDIGMSSSGLHVFLNGSRPHPGTVKKVQDWATSLADSAAPDARDVEAAVALLRMYLDRDPKARSKRLSEIVTRLE